jgi:hypothetical protein
MIQQHPNIIPFKTMELHQKASRIEKYDSLCGELKKTVSAIKNQHFKIASFLHQLRACGVYDHSQIDVIASQLHQSAENLMYRVKAESTFARGKSA